MNELLQFLLPTQLLKPLLKPIVRLFLGLVAIPIFRLFVRKVVRVQDLDEELEKDLELWFRGALLLLIATSNMESTVFFMASAGSISVNDRGATAPATCGRSRCGRISGTNTSAP